MIGLIDLEGEGEEAGQSFPVSTAKRLDNNRRQDASLSEQDAYLTGPPKGQKLFEVLCL